jgi:Flp pilus assembly protein protease CpaA
MGGAKAKAIAGAGVATGAGGAVVGGLPFVAAVLGMLTVAILALLVWTVADASRTRRLAELIRAYRTPTMQTQSWPRESTETPANASDGA